MFTEFERRELRGAALIAEEVVTGVRSRPWGLGAVAVHGGDATMRIDEGRDAFTPTSLFELGSLTKTMTGLLLADAVIADECALTTTVGDILGPNAGRAANTSLLQLATHTSGLPRLPVGMAPTNASDPYAEVTRDDLVLGLSSLPPLEPGSVTYSNLGFMLLGILLETLTGSDYEHILQTRLLQPLEMTMSGTQPPQARRLPGYRSNEQAPWWSGLPGAGQVASSLADMVRYLRFVLDGTGASDRLQAALKLATAVHVQGAQPMGLGWHQLGGGLWHNGDTGGFHTMAVVYRPKRSAIFLVGNAADLSQLDAVGFAITTDIARGRLKP